MLRSAFFVSVSLLALNFGICHASNSNNLQVVSVENGADIDGFLSARNNYRMDDYLVMFDQGGTFFDQFKQKFAQQKGSSAYCLGLIQSYILEWKALAGICGEYFSAISQLQNQTEENKKILEYLSQNKTSFPVHRKTHVALLDGLTKQDKMSLSVLMGQGQGASVLQNLQQGLGEVSSRLQPIHKELSNPLATGVEAFKKILKDENASRAEEIAALVTDYKKYATRFQLVAVELGTDSMMEMMTKVSADLSKQIAEADSDIKSIEESPDYLNNLVAIHEDLRWLKDRVNNRRGNNPALNAFYNQFDKPWHWYFNRYTTFKQEVIKMFNGGNAQEDCISALFEKYDDQEIKAHLESLKNDKNASEMLKAMARSLERLELWRGKHQEVSKIQAAQSEKIKQKQLVEGMRSLAASKDERGSFLVKKAVQQIDAVDFLIANHSREELWQAYEDLKSENRAQAIVQIVNDLIEKKVKGFPLENFTRYLLVSFVTPNLVPSVQKLLDKLVIKIADKLGVDASQPFDKVVTLRDEEMKFAPHFPEVAELQRARGALGHDLIRIIENLPIEFFGDMVRAKVEQALEGRDTFLQEKGARLSQVIVKKISRVMQKSLVAAIRKNFAAPCLMNLDDKEFAGLLKGRNDDSVAELNRLRQAEQALVEKMTVFGSDKTAKGAKLVKNIDNAAKNMASTIHMADRLNTGARLLTRPLQWFASPVDACTDLYHLVKAGADKLQNYAAEKIVDMFDNDDDAKAIVATKEVKPAVLRAQFLSLIDEKAKFQTELNN